MHTPPAVRGGHHKTDPTRATARALRMSIHPMQFPAGEHNRAPKAAIRHV